MIGIIDYGMSNLGSVVNACRFLNMPARLVAQPEEMDACAAVILPGQGSFGDCMQHLETHGLVSALRDWMAEGRPYLGICLGLQVLFESSEESPGIAGIGIYPGHVRRFQLASEFKVPQIGWNAVRQVQPDCPLFRDVADEVYVYFVHSYYVDPNRSDIVAGVTEYGAAYASAVWRDNVVAVQFHPEKSQQDGLKMLRNFGTWVEQGAQV